MKLFYCTSLMILTACSSTPLPKVNLHPQQPLANADANNLRYPEVIQAYHFGRYTDPNDSLVMHEQHVAYRVEEISRWDLHPAESEGSSFPLIPPRDSAFFPAPVNDAILAEVNSQRLATTQIMVESKLLRSALQQLQRALNDSRTNQEVALRLQVTVNDLKKRFVTLEAAQAQTATNPSPTNTPGDLNP